VAAEALCDVDGVKRGVIAVSAVRSVRDHVMDWTFRCPSDSKGRSVVHRKSDGGGRVDWIASASSLLASPYR
jgi:hypothetical protein